MSSDEKIAKRSLDFQKRAVDVPLMRIPGYMAWSNQKLADGGSPDLIAHLDATDMWLLPEEAGSVSTVDFEELWEELKHEFGEW